MRCRTLILCPKVVLAVRVGRQSFRTNITFRLFSENFSGKMAANRALENVELNGASYQKRVLFHINF